MIDEHARSRLIRRYGESVNEWITTLPVVIDTLAARWDLTTREAQALTAWAGTGAAVALLDTDLARGALLLEALGAEATDPARVVPALQAADPAGFPPLTAHVDFQMAGQAATGSLA